jgi:hypothetical protein
MREGLGPTTLRVLNVIDFFEDSCLSLIWLLQDIGQARQAPKWVASAALDPQGEGSASAEATGEGQSLRSGVLIVRPPHGLVIPCPASA